MPIDSEELVKRFQYHAPSPEQQEKYIALRAQAFTLARSIAELVPESREQSLALTQLEEAVFWANAGIARRS